jgi:hypothetical protein
MKSRPVSVEAAASAGRSECTDPLKLAAGVLIEYADMIEEGEVNRSGPLKGRCAPAIEEEVAEYRRLAAALIARSQTLSVSVPIRTLDRWGEMLEPYRASDDGSYNNDGVINVIAEMATLVTGAGK